MARQNCLDENDGIITDKLALAFEEGRLDIQLLCSALGRQALDQSFLDEVIDDEWADCVIIDDLLQLLVQIVCNYKQLLNFKN